MKVLHISTADLRHGAGRAAFHLHQSLRKHGVDSRMLVAEKSSDDPDVKSLIKTNPVIRNIQNGIELIINTLGPQNTFSFIQKELLRHPWFTEADVIHCHNLHWPFKNFSLHILKTGHQKPLIWTFHDMWPVTGHCYHSFKCSKWRTGCMGGCPHLQTFIPLAWDSCPTQWNIKKEIYSHAKFHVVAPSQWLMDIARASPLLQGHSIDYIPNAVDTSIFVPKDKAAARRELRLSPDERIVLFVAANINVPLKGLDALLETRVSLKGTLPFRLIIAGGGKIPGPYRNDPGVECFGKVTDDKFLTMLYTAADLTVVPSTAENCPNVVIESMACQTPVVGSRVGGIPDMIDHQVNGYLFSAENKAQMAEGLLYYLNNEKERNKAGVLAREKIERVFSENKVTTAYLNLYKKSKI